MLFLGAIILGGCTSNTTGSAIFDPYEDTNRKTHEFNKNLDKYIKVKSMMIKKHTNYS